MNTITLYNTLPAVFAEREPVPSQVWRCEVSFERGRYYLVSAESGTGKSSLCSYLYGYRRDYEGVMRFDERDLRSLAVEQWCYVRKHELAYLPQDMKLFAELTALENVELKNQLTAHKTRREIEDFFERLDIADKLHCPVAKLSIGQQQRVALIRALCQPADFIVLDEPVSHLDEQRNHIAAAIVDEEARRMGAGVIATSVGNPLQLTYHSHLEL